MSVLPYSFTAALIGVNLRDVIEYMYTLYIAIWSIEFTSQNHMVSIERFVTHSQKLEESKDVMKITRYDKEEIVFYCNKEYELEVDEGECGWEVK